MERIKVILGDITKQRTDAIVNAANESLLAGGGVCGAIHTAAGRELEKECITLGGCRAGEAVITSGYNLPSKYVIHTVAPRWYEKAPDREEKLKSCYIQSLKLAVKYGIKTIAFPSLGTGIFKTPITVGSKIAVETVREFLKNNDSIEQVVFVCFSEDNLSVYMETLKM